MACAAEGTYKLDTGDIVEIDIFGMPEFKRRVAVNIDGDVAIPFVGGLPASGLSLAELRRSIGAALIGAGAMQNPQVTVEIAEHRPFFISGDVSRPGATAYRKGLTVRHAIALSGGFDALRFRSENPLMAAPELRARHQALLLDLARAEARLASAHAEAADKSDFELATPNLQGAASGVLEDIARGERHALATRMQEWTKQQEFQRMKVAQAREQVAALTNSLEQQTEAAKHQTVAMERTAANVMKGVAAINRGDEERRSLAMMKATETDTRSRLAAASTEWATATRELDKMAAERAANLQKGIEAASVDREKIKLDLRALAEKLLYAGALKAQMGRAATPEITIHRTVHGEKTSIVADQDTQILPGDLIEVMIDPMAVASR
jgi:polysaccharide export outer membrane protein